MLPKDFVKLFHPDSVIVEKETGLSALATDAQAAWESGWNEHTISNNFFGQKSTDPTHKNAILITTTEYHSRADVKYPVIISITPIVIDGVKKFKYLIKDYFVSYATPADCFRDHAKFFQTNPRYAEAWKVRTDPEAFIHAIAEAGYATDPNYAKNLISIIHTIKNNIPTN